MSVNATIYNYMGVSIGGELVEIGSRETAQSVTVDGTKFEAVCVVADNYTREVIWEAGDAGIDDFDLVVITSDADVLLELTMDKDGSGTGPAIATLGLLADVPFILTSDDMLNAEASGTPTATELIDRIAIQNNVINAAGDAVVRVLIVT